MHLLADSSLNPDVVGNDRATVTQSAQTGKAGDHIRQTDDDSEHSDIGKAPTIPIVAEKKAATKTQCVWHTCPERLPERLISARLFPDYLAN